MSVRDVLNAIKLLFGMSSVDLSRIKWFVLKIGQIFFLFLVDLANSLKMPEILWSATLKQNTDFLFSISRSL